MDYKKVTHQNIVKLDLKVVDIDTPLGTTTCHQPLDSSQCSA